MMSTNKVFKELFNCTDTILIIDINGKVLYYEDYNDQINMIRDKDAVGKSIFELYPFFKYEDFTVFKAMDTKSVIVNELQQYEVNGVPKKSLNSAYPLMNETGVIGCMVMSVELNSKGGRKKRQGFYAKYDFDDIVTQNADFIASFSKLKMLARSSANIIIYGETGTGKELIAHSVHANSPRKNNPFIVQNCAAIPGNLMESILFGSSKGSFTGAIDKPGLFEVCDGGTLYLDEINSLSLDLQGKLLRAIENNSIRRIGENIEREIDIRIITSTNEHLSQMVKNKKFRKDLFYRLNVASYSIPPLRERKDDLPLLCKHLINQYNSKLNHHVQGIDNSVMDFFRNYYWEGNIRELKNVIEYGCTIKYTGNITMYDLPSYMITPNNKFLASVSSSKHNGQLKNLNTFIKPGTTLEGQISILEKEIIKSSLERNHYCVTKTATELNISRQTLYNKIDKYKLE